MHPIPGVAPTAIGTHQLYGLAQKSYINYLILTCTAYGCLFDCDWLMKSGRTQPPYHGMKKPPGGFSFAVSHPQPRFFARDGQGRSPFGKNRRVWMQNREWRPRGFCVAPGQKGVAWRHRIHTRRFSPNRTSGKRFLAENDGYGRETAHNQSNELPPGGFFIPWNSRRTPLTCCGNKNTSRRYFSFDWVALKVAGVALPDVGA